MKRLKTRPLKKGVGNIFTGGKFSKQRPGGQRSLVKNPEHNAGGGKKKRSGWPDRDEKRSKPTWGGIGSFRTDGMLNQKSGKERPGNGRNPENRWEKTRKERPFLVQK